MAVYVARPVTTSELPIAITVSVYSRAYGCDELQPGSSMNRALVGLSIHVSNSMMCVLLLIASPGRRSVAMIAYVRSVLNGANWLVTRPGAGSFHAHDTRPEQSERYGSQSMLSSRL